MPRRKAATAITDEHIISTLAYIRSLTDALLATLMDRESASYPQLPAPLGLYRAYNRECPPPEDRAYARDCPPPEDRAYARDCPPPEDSGAVAVTARSSNCPTMYLMPVPPMKETARKRPPKKKSRG